MKIILRVFGHIRKMPQLSNIFYWVFRNFLHRSDVPYCQIASYCAIFRTAIVFITIKASKCAYVFVLIRLRFHESWKMCVCARVCECEWVCMCLFLEQWQTFYEKHLYGFLWFVCFLLACENIILIEFHHFVASISMPLKINIQNKWLIFVVFLLFSLGFSFVN